MRRAAWIALVVVPLVTMPTWVHAAPPCGDPILQRHCVYLPAAIGPAGRGCERITGDAFDDSTAWRFLEPSGTRVSLISEAAKTGGSGARLSSAGSRPVGVQSVAIVRWARGRDVWMTGWYREVEGTSGPFSDGDSLAVCAIPSERLDSTGMPGCWKTVASIATTEWGFIGEDMTSRVAIGYDLRLSVEARGETNWDVDDVALWACKPGERPR